MFIHLSTAPRWRPLSHLHRSRAARRPPPQRTSAKRRRLDIGLIAEIAAAALSFGLEPLGKQARSETISAPDRPCASCFGGARVFVLPVIVIYTGAVYWRQRAFRL